MRAVLVEPGRAGSAQLADVPEPPVADGPIVVTTHAIGVCGTDAEILAGSYGAAPPGHHQLVLGHESIGRVLVAPPGGELRVGDWVVGIVRRPDPVPCANCAIGEWDMCRNGRFSERGIKGLHGFGAERYRITPAYTIKVDDALAELGVLLEPASIVAKAWEHVERIGVRAGFAPERVLVTGAGPIGLLAAMLGTQRGLEVVVLDRRTEGPKPALVQALGATYTTTDLDGLHGQFDVVLECTGVPQLVLGAIAATRANGITCLTGVSSRGRTLPVDLAAVNRRLVLENNVVFGSVNANRRHYAQAARALAAADRGWLARLLTRRVPLARWTEALVRTPTDVKPIIAFTESGQ